MSSSKHMVRVLREEPADAILHAAARPTHTRTILLACLTLCVTCLVAVSLAPQFPHILAVLQGRLSLAHYLFG